MRRRCCAIPADVEGIRNVNDATPWLCPGSRRAKHARARSSQHALNMAARRRDGELGLADPGAAARSIAGSAGARRRTRCRSRALALAGPAATCAAASRVGGRRAVDRPAASRLGRAVLGLLARVLGRVAQRRLVGARCRARPSSASAAGPRFLVALSTRNVTKPPTRTHDEDDRDARTPWRGAATPALSGTKRSPAGLQRSPRCVRTTHADARPEGRHEGRQARRTRRTA